MAEYSYNDIMKMQNDAIKRVNEMQKRAKTVVEEINEEKTQVREIQTPQNSQNIKRVKMPDDYLDELKSFASTSSYFEENKSEPIKREYVKEKEENRPPPKAQNDMLKNILGDLNMDSDKALILSLILLLTEEKADEMLILALLYILS